MASDIQKHINALCDIANKTPKASKAINMYKEALDFNESFVPNNENDEKDQKRLKGLLRDIRIEFGIYDGGVKTHPQLEGYIHRLQELVDNHPDVDDIDALQEEVAEMKEEMSFLSETVLINREGYIPHYTEERINLFEKLVKQVSAEYDFYDPEAEMDMMFPNRHDDDYDDDDFSIYGFFGED